jgi:hypothetical protein
MDTVDYEMQVVKVGVSGDEVALWIGDGIVALRPEQARRMAVALVRAADEAEGANEQEEEAS